MRVRLTALYGGLFLASGAGLLAITYVLVAGLRTNAAFQIAGTVRGDFELVPALARAQVRGAAGGLPASVAAALQRLLKQIASTQVQNLPSVTRATSLPSVTSVTSVTSLAAPPVAAGPFQPQGPEFVGFQAILPTAPELHNLLIFGGIALAIMAVVSIGLGWLVAGRAFSPIRVMTSNARHISAENLHERLGLQGPPDELKDLGDTIDDLLARLETAFEAQKRFVANASHELRTPLTMMRTSVDVAVGKPHPPAEVRVLAGKVGEGLDEADRILEGLLLLARAQRGAMGDMTAVSLPDLVASAIPADQPEITREEPHSGKPGLHRDRNGKCDPARPHGRKRHR